MSNLRKTLLGRNVNKRIGPAGGSQQDYAPVKWSKYYDSEDKVILDEGTFNVYKKGESGPVLVCLHGGGYSGLTWALFASEISALIECQVLAIDLRGHGNTITKNDKDLCLETLAKDVVNIIECLYQNTPVVLVGHSMGGAVAVDASFLIENTLALCVIDVVEGTALDALSSMQSILRGRPKSFRSIQEAIQWCHKGGQTHNVEAAKVSMPGQIKNVENGKLAADECDTIKLKTVEELERKKPSSSSLPIVEEETGSGDCGKPPLPKTAKTESSRPAKIDLLSAGDSLYIWRIDLSKTEHFWTGWFKGLSQKFLETTMPKLLLLASINGLDTALTVGQMQGKFQMQVLPKSGHAIHEDQPQHVAEMIGSFLVKQKIAVARGELFSPMPSC